MCENFFFDIPVYRLSETDYDAEIENHIGQVMLGKEEGEWEFRKSFYKRNPIFRDRLQKQYGDWKFNEIIGYVRLYIEDNQVLGEYWRTDAKRIVRSRRKLFNWSTYNIEPERGDLPLDGTNQEIYETILSYLEAVRVKLKGRVLDTSVFEAIGGYIDWHSFIRNT